MHHCNQYREALENVRKKAWTGIACGIFPRLGHGRQWLPEAIGFNRRVENYCRGNNVSLLYVDVWDNFFGNW